MTGVHQEESVTWHTQGAATVANDDWRLPWQECPEKAGEDEPKCQCA